MMGNSSVTRNRWAAVVAICLPLLVLGTLPSCRSRPSLPPDVGDELVAAMLSGDLDGAADMLADGFQYNGTATDRRQFVERVAAEAERGRERPEAMVDTRFSGRYDDTIGDESPLEDEVKRKVEAAGERLGLGSGDLVVLLGSDEKPLWLWLYWQNEGGGWKVVAAED